jgi:predicted ATP-grasp superfamily ATP-dependent carboligase
MRRAVMVLGGHRQSISVVRALAARGWRVILGQSTPGISWIGRSRSVNQIWHHPGFNEPRGAFRIALTELLRRDTAVRAIFPVGDTEIDAIDAIRDDVPERVALVLPPSAAIRMCRDKRVTMDIARAQGVPLADFRVIETATDWDVADRVAFPAVFKPISERTQIFGNKVFRARCLDDYRRAVDRHGPPQGPLIVQTFVEGSRYNVYFYANDGVVRAALMVRVLRTDRLDDTGYAVEAMTVPMSKAWLAHLERLVGALQYSGAGCLQYIRDDANGRESFLEINARLGANYRTAEIFGLELPVWWVADATGETARIPDAFTYPAGKHVSWSFGDLDGLITTLAGGNANASTLMRWSTQSIRTLTRWRHLTWAWDDPMPTLWRYAALKSGLLRQHHTGKNAASANPVRV